MLQNEKLFSSGYIRSGFDPLTGINVSQRLQKYNIPVRNSKMIPNHVSSKSLECSENNGVTRDGICLANETRIVLLLLVMAVVGFVLILYYNG